MKLSVVTALIVLAASVMANEPGKNPIEHVGDWVAHSPGPAIAIGVGVLFLGLPGLVTAPLLGAAGFGAAGPVAGMAAATIQAGIGSVVAPSLFATLQSAAMGGYGLAAVNGAVQAVGLVTGLVGSLLAWWGAALAAQAKVKDDKGNESDEHHS